MNAAEMMEIFNAINMQHPAAPTKKGQNDVNSWLAVLLPDMGYSEAFSALREWYAAQSSFITPAALNNLVKSIRARDLAHSRRLAMGEQSHDCMAMNCRSKRVKFADWAARNPEMAELLHTVKGFGKMEDDE